VCQPIGEFLASMQHFVEMICFYSYIISQDYSLCQQIMSDLCAKNFKCKGQNGKRAFGPGAFKEVAISKSFYLSYGHF